jgi:hypothetical protein
MGRDGWGLVLHSGGVLLEGLIQLGGKYRKRLRAGTRGRVHVEERNAMQCISNAQDSNIMELTMRFFLAKLVPGVRGVRLRSYIDPCISCYSCSKINCT